MRIDAEAGILAQLQALADPTRARLLLVLDRHELTVGELCQVLQLPQSTVSRHLRNLADDDWVLARADGPSRIYRLAGLDAERRKLWALVAAGMAGSAAARQDALRVPAVLAQRRVASTDFFAGAAGEWDALRAELFGQRTDINALLALLDNGWTVGDLGCGTGQLAAVLAPFVQRVIAVDASEAMLAAARVRFAAIEPEASRAVELRAGELEALPVSDGELDAAVLSLVLHHAVEPATVLAEARRALAPGGRLVVVEMLPHAHAEYRQTMGHVWQGFEPAQMEDWLNGAGFRGVRIRPLAMDLRAQGPALFVATARAAAVEDFAARDSRGAPPDTQSVSSLPDPGYPPHAVATILSR